MRLLWNIRETFMEYLPDMWEECYLPFYRNIYHALYLIISTYVQLFLSGVRERFEPFVIFSHRIDAIVQEIPPIIDRQISRITEDHTIPLFVILRRYVLLFVRIFQRTTDAELYRVVEVAADALAFALNVGFWLLCIYGAIGRMGKTDPIPQPGPLSWVAEHRMNYCFHNAERIGQKLRWRYTADGEVVDLPSYVFS
ncbi:hypothetical protein Daesc_000327 [Daldinia eschscholtzii]|uniref:Bestrophin homolog n=1 Tax=Daldinia eschscholtzii TaxID=292717 RepID=A0AAX6MY03_9PEZI